MVNLVEDWKELEDYSRWCRYGCYQTREASDGMEVRVVVGRFGYIKAFEDPGDKLLKRIVNFCEAEGFIKIVGNVPDELFFVERSQH